MKTKYRLNKIIITIFLTFLLCINSSAAAVSDNDGSAFITKAEFDSLKNDFQAKINQFNTEIDNKISNAISGYISGIKVSKDPSNYFNLIKTALGEVRFLNNAKTTSGTITTNEILNIYRHWFQHRYTGMSYITRFYPGTWPEKNTLYWTYAVALIKSGTESSFTDQDKSTFLAMVRDGVWTGNGTAGGTWITGPNGNFNEMGSQTGISSKSVYGTNNVTVETAGSGQLYRYKVTPSGRRVLTQYASSFYPVCNINVYGHSYINYATNFSANYTGSNLQKDTTSLSCSVGSLTTYGSIGTGTPYSPTYTGAAATRWAAQVYNVVTTDNIKYEQMIWGLVPSGNIYCIDEAANLSAGTSKTKAASDTQSTISAENWGSAQGMSTADVTLSGVQVSYAPPKFTSESKNIGNFSNDYVSTIVGDTVYHGQGILIGKMPQEGKCKITLKFKNAGGENASLRYILTDGKVGATGTKILSNYTNVNCNSTVTVNKTIDFNAKSDIWINCYSNTTGVNLILDSVELKLDR